MTGIVTRSASSKRKPARGHSMMEAVAGVIVLVPLVLLSIDAMAVINANHTNQELAQTVCRAAANSRKSDAAQQAAQDTVSAYPKSGLIHDVLLANFQFDVPRKVVTVSIRMTVAMPVPLPGISDVQLTAGCSQPIVALPPSV